MERIIETRKQLDDRHRREREMFGKACKHKCIIITEGIDGMERLISTHKVKVVGELNSFSLVIRCTECGVPIFSITQGKVDFAEGFEKIKTI